VLAIAERSVNVSLTFIRLYVSDRLSVRLFVCLLVCFHPYLLNRLTSDLELVCAWVMTIARLGLTVKVIGQGSLHMGVVTQQHSRSDLDPLSRTVFQVLLLMIFADETAGETYLQSRQH